MNSEKEIGHIEASERMGQEQQERVIFKITKGLDQRITVEWFALKLSFDLPLKHYSRKLHRAKIMRGFELN